MRTFPCPRRIALCVAALSALLQLTGCGERNAHAQAGAGAPPTMPVPVVTATPERLTITTELPGRLEATRVAEVRARVPGIVQKRAFREGSQVKAGQVLFEIDPAPYKAAVSSAEAALARAQASLGQARLRVQRYRPLVETNAVSKQEFDEAVAAEKHASADVAAAKAALQMARLNLGHATVKAPISGRVGRALVTEGALVGQGEATPLAVIQQLDPIFANLTQPGAEALQLRRAMAEGRLQTMGKDGARVTILLEDGHVYGHAGKLLFSDLTVDQSTGAITLRAEIPNPDQFLLPGMYVRARVEQAVNENAIAVPQQAVQRGANGATVFLVGEGNQVEIRPVTTGAAHGNRWMIAAGLKGGEQVIVEGFQKLRPGMTVNPVPWQPRQDAGAANR